MGNAFAQHLRALNYNALASPTSRFGIMSLVYEHKGSRGWSSDLGLLVRDATQPRPVQQGPVAEPNLSGKEVRDLSIGGTINILSGLISALGGGTLGLKGGFERASTVTFRYGDVSAIDVSEGELDRYIQSGTSDPGSVPGRYLRDHLYVASRILRSRSFEVSAKDANNQSIALDLPVISNAIGAKVETKWSQTSERTIAFAGDVDVTFAFQAFRILEKAGKMRIFPAAAGAGGLAHVYADKIDVAGIKGIVVDGSAGDLVEASEQSMGKPVLIAEDAVAFDREEGQELD